MKTLVFGDTHGRRLWQRITATEDFDRVIFIGDYFDSFDILPEEQMENFKDICQFAQSGKKVIMLIGNHDFHYMKEAGGETYSGYKSAYASSIGYLLGEARPLMQVCFEEDGILFSHAGLTKTWCKENGVDVTNIEASVNSLWATDPEKFRFSGWDETGDDKTQGPFWVRPRSLSYDLLDGYTQIVGHTGVKKIIQSPDTRMYLIDAIGTYQYLEVTDCKIEVKTYPHYRAY